MIGLETARNPVWRAEQLGQPIPDSEHAVSMALPQWQDVVDYEEKQPRLRDRIRTGYPRFVIHPLVSQAAARIAGPNAVCLPFPSAAVAQLGAHFIEKNSGQPAEIREANGLWGLVTNPTGETALRAFWQHSGLIVSSRQAEAWLAGRPPVADTGVHETLRAQLAELYSVEPDDVFLAPSGMAAQTAALLALRDRAPEQPTAQLGFPYVDTLKLQRKLGNGGILLHHLQSIESELIALANSTELAGCFSEIPGNPLLGSADARRISPVLRERGIPLVVDDVVATPANIDVLPFADLIATSLTKFVVGTGEAMAGALICNPRSPFYHELKPRVRARDENLLWPGDAEVISRNARGFKERMRIHNQNGLEIAERLRRHPAIERVWYPKWEFSGAYEAVRRPDGGWGALITFLPRNAEQCSPRIFDRLQVCKGPSLGTVFTLACPFTLLAHYTELDWAESCGVSRHLIRISVGLEEIETLWSRLAVALEPDR